MPSEKRQRQRALRQVRVAEQQRQDRRRRGLRRGVGAVVIGGVIVGIILAITSGSTPKKPVAAPKVTTTTLQASTVSTTPVSHKAVAPTCPPAAGAAKRVIAFTAAPANCVVAGATYDATVTTDVGSFVIQLPVNASPAAVNNFVFLARYHFYDGVTFHRVIPGFVVQGGDPTGTGAGGPGYNFTGNTPAKSCGTKCYPLGAVALANSGTTASDGSQFFIVVGTQGEALPPNYTLFGQVISGMAVVQKIAADGTPQGVPPKVLHHMVKVTVTQQAA